MQLKKIARPILQFTFPGRVLCNRVSISLLVIIYIAVFVPVYSLVGPPAASIITLPVVWIAWCSGVWAGILSAVLAFPLNTLLLNLVGNRGWDAVFQLEGELPMAVLIPIGALVGLYSDIYRRLRIEINERERAEEELKYSTRQLSNLSVHLQSAREEERAVIAREIHDEFGQMLTALQMDLFWLREKTSDNKKKIHEKIASMSEIVDTIIQSTQRISAELRPVLLDTLGLSAAIEWQVEEFIKRTNINCEAVIDSVELDLDPDRAMALFRILQESLTNITRHSNATEVVVRLTRLADKLVLKVVDNGIGISSKQISSSMALGIISMRERIRPWGGSFNIYGIDGKGTTVTATISIND